MLKASHNPRTESIRRTNDFLIFLLSVDTCKMMVIITANLLEDWTEDNSGVVVVVGTSAPQFFSTE